MFVIALRKRIAILQPILITMMIIAGRKRVDCKESYGCELPEKVPLLNYIFVKLTAKLLLEKDPITVLT